MIFLIATELAKYSFLVNTPFLTQGISPLFSKKILWSDNKIRKFWGSVIFEWSKAGAGNLFLNRAKIWTKIFGGQIC